MTKFALEKWASGAKCSFPGSDCLIVRPPCRWLLMAPSIQKSTSCVSLWVKYLHRQYHKSVRGNLKNGAAKTTSKPHNNCADGGVITGEEGSFPPSVFLLSFLISAFCVFVLLRWHQEKGRIGFCSNSWWIHGHITVLRKKNPGKFGVWWYWSHSGWIPTCFPSTGACLKYEVMKNSVLMLKW